MNTDEIKLLTESEQDELLQLIGKSLYVHQKTALPPNKKELQNRGERWWDKNLKILKRNICKNAYQYIEMQKKDEIQLVLAIADVISGLTLGAPPFVVAALFVKIGITRICDVGG